MAASPIYVAPKHGVGRSCPQRVAQAQRLRRQRWVVGMLAVAALTFLGLAYRAAITG